MEEEALLKPMPPDALIRRRDAVASAPISPSVQFLSEENRDPEALHKPVFAHFPVKNDAAPEKDLDDLLCAYLPDEDDDEPDADAVPTHLMPMPACVPLYEEPTPRRRRSRR